MTDPNNPASVLAGMRKTYDHSCKICGDPFTGLERALYCSNSCKQRAKYARMKADMVELERFRKKAKKR